MKALKYLFTFAIALMVLPLSAQLMVAEGESAEQMAQTISGPNVQILNPVITCADEAWGTFEASVNDFQPEQGILLTTGKVDNALGPNNSEAKTTVNLAGADPKLSTLAGYETSNACKLEFDIIPQGDTLRFAFTFASEEYSEYVCTPFNDVFGFFISGPGIAGDPDLDFTQNIAVVPGTNDPISIDNINQGNPNLPDCPIVNPQYHVLNPISPLADIQYDGWTTGLVAVAGGLIPCETYHLELIIADASDRLWDSGVFIEKIESNNLLVEVTTDGGIDVMYEECNNATISFCLENTVNTVTDITYFLQGTAINGTDYELINDPDPNFPHSIQIPAGQQCVFQEVTSIWDGIDEAPEYIDVFVNNPLCSGDILDSVRVFLLDTLEVSVMGDKELCIGESTTLEAQGGGTSFQWTASPDVDFSPDNTSTTVSITPNQSTDVTLTTSVAECLVQETLEVQVSDMELQFDITGITCEGVCDGAIDMTILNGIEGYTITWNDVVSPEDISGLCAGTYEVRVVDAAGCVISETVVVGNAEPMQVIITPLEYQGGFNISCNGESDGSITAVTVGGNAPYTYTFTPPGQTNLPAGPVTVSVVDSSGCTASNSITLVEPQVLDAEISDVEAASCLDGNDGSATVTCIGGSGICPLYQWYANGVLVNTGSTYDPAPAGTYNVVFEDQNGCTDSIEVVIPGSENELTGAVVSSSNVSCNGLCDGSVEVTGSGGTLDPGSDYQYLWLDDNSTSPSRTGLCAGIYTVIITDDAGCDVSLSINITEPDELEVIIPFENDIQCEGQTCGSALAVGTGGTPGDPAYTYVWDVVAPTVNPAFPVSTATAQFCLPGVYEVTVTDDNGCTAMETVEIEIISEEIIATFEITDVDCAGSSTGAIDATVTGGSGGFTYVWNGGNCGQGPLNTQDISSVCAGIWCVTITDSEGCTLDTCLTINEPPALNYFFEMEPTLCADNCTGSIDYTPVGGTPPYSYEWYGPVFPIDPSPTAFDGLPLFSSTEDLDNLCKGQYLIILSDSLGCTFERRITVTAPEDMVIQIDSISDYNGFQISCPEACDGYIYTTTTGGTVDPAYDYTFTWFEQAIDFTDQGVNSPFDDQTGLCASMDTVGYEIIAEDENGCLQNAFIIMEEPDEIEVDFEVTDVSCPGLSDGAVTAIINGGVPGYSVQWTDGGGTPIDTTLTISGLPVGTYYIDVTDLNGCMATDSVVITVPDPLVVSLDFVPQNGGNAIGCDGDCDGIIFAVANGGTPDYEYEWSEIGCFGPYFSMDDSSVGGLCEGDYFVNITDENGCEACADISLVAPDPISAPDSVVTDVSCPGAMDGMIDLGLEGGSGSLTFTWVPDVGNGELVTGLDVGTYEVFIEDSVGCTAMFSFEIEEPTPLDVVATSPLQNGFNISCANACDAEIYVSVIGGGGGAVITWQGPAGFTPNAAGDTLTNVCAGQHIVTVTEGACSASDTIDITEPLDIVVVISELQSITCNGECDGQLQAAAVGGASGFTYAWNDPAMTTGPVTPDDLCERQYCVTVTDQTDCSVVQCYNLQEPDVLTPNCVVTPVSCTGQDDGSIACNISGGTAPYTCSWTGPNGFSSNAPSLVNLAPGEYCLTCVDANGCELPETCYTVDEPTPLILTAVVSDYNGFQVSCDGACDGAIDLSATGGTAGYTFDPGQNNTGICQGQITVSVTDAADCTVEQVIDMMAPEPIIVNLTSPVFFCGTNINCQGDSTGAILSDVSGGVMPYTYTWVDLSDNSVIESGNFPNIDLLPAGDYELTVTDINGCEGQATITLTEPTDPFDVDVSLSMNPSGDAVPCAGECAGSMSFSSTGNCGPVNYQVQGPGGAAVTDFDALCAGDYVIIALDSAQCLYVEEIELTEPAEPFVVGADVSSALCPGDPSGDITLGATGGTAPYVYDWVDPLLDDVMVQTGLEAGVYDVEVSDDNGCSEFLSITIADPDTITIELTSEILILPDFNISSFMGADGNIDATVTGGTAPYSYLWLADDGTAYDTEDLNGLTAQVYCLTVTDANGCVAGQCIELLEPMNLDLPNGMSPNGDGLNDGLFIQGLEAFPENRVVVFNRWGDEVYSKNNYRNGDMWRGESDKGGVVPDGTYFVLLTVNNGERELDAYLEVRR